ncbi:hypothetical protein PN499_19325 [Kamptonema animale CS-326]|jgi:hypothetical protein|uniref:hypothetical protein n=1 Tax=Kamptonema animale TaxID=92934 RepID=UPI00232E72A4|nr:hypothetical protein [Kamptonema animale]MDB9513349.1 hypothetical protein [Kamptonema animale CS-326]
MADIKHNTNESDANLDPISGEPGAHPVGTGIGAASAGAAGAAIGGAIGGPVGAVVGAAVGAVAGGLVGKGAAESVNPTEEEAYWEENYNSRPYAEVDTDYEYYRPAYRTGYEGYSRYRTTGKSFDEIEGDLQRDYEKNRGKSNLSWEKAKYAARDAWDKVERKVPGDIDRDGR